MELSAACLPDAAALFFAGGIALLYHLFIARRRKLCPLRTVQGVASAARKDWVASVVRGRDGILGVQTLRNSTMVASFMASTSSVLALGVLSLAASAGDRTGAWRLLHIFGTPSPDLLVFKVLALLLVLALSLTLVACGSGKKDAASTGSYKVAMVTDYGDITDQSFNQTTYEACQKFAGDNGYGRLDLMENRMVGLKSRECYEVPAALTLITAHKALEDLTLERDALHQKLYLEQTWATCVYNGQWFSPLKKALDAFMAETQKFVTGTVRLKFFKGHCTVMGRKSPCSLYDYGLATYDRDTTFDEKAAVGFIEIETLSLKTWAKMQGPTSLAAQNLS